LNNGVVGELEVEEEVVSWGSGELEMKEPLHQNRITLAAKNRQEICLYRQDNDPWRLAAKQIPPKIEGQGKSIYLAASRQRYFSWRFGRQAKQMNDKISIAPRKTYTCQGNYILGCC